MAGDYNFLQWRNLEIFSNLSFRSAAVSREESAVFVLPTSRFLAEKTGSE